MGQALLFKPFLFVGNAGLTDEGSPTGRDIISLVFVKVPVMEENGIDLKESFSEVIEYTHIKWDKVQIRKLCEFY